MAGNVTKSADQNGTVVGPEFDWTKQQQGYLNSAFFYGYLGMSLPSGWLSGRFGAHRCISIGMFINSVLCLLTPLVARWNFDALIVLRVLQGLSQAFTYPGFSALMGKWAPKKDLGLIAAIATSGSSFGVILVFTAGSALVTHGFGHRSYLHYSGDNWPSIFYVFGAGSLLATILWFTLCYESPAVHPYITMEERVMIETDIAASDSKHLTEFTFLDVFPLTAFLPASIRRRTAVPWRSILLSIPMWGITLIIGAGDFGQFTLMTCVPTYYHEVYKFDVLDSGLYTALPPMSGFCIGVLSGIVVTFPCWYRNISTIATRRIFTCLSHMGMAGFLLAAAYSKSKSLAVAMVTASSACGSFITNGAVLNMIDLSPRFAGVLVAWTNSFGAVGGIVGPYIADVLTPNKTAAEWREVFFITSGLLFAAAVVYVIAASVKRQPWSEGEIFPGGSDGAGKKSPGAAVVKERGVKTDTKTD
ncbi:sialin-like [Sycon ciliatum]|uniref:sialin-like n=1 Tax=Sycon ciliatum TaxID=27933 RepID=UPI0031F6B713